VIADKGYDGDRLVAAIRSAGAEPVIPPMRHRREPRVYDRAKYRLRNVAERFWGCVKRFRRVATRYDKLAHRFLAFVQIASAMVALKQKTVHTP
jgi:transposase